MWMTALVGMSTNFFTSTLAIMYRGKDSEGVHSGRTHVRNSRSAWAKNGSPSPIYSASAVWLDACRFFRPINLTQAIVDIGITSEEIKNASTFTLSWFCDQHAKIYYWCNHHVLCWYRYTGWHSTHWKLGRQNGAHDDCYLFSLGVQHT
jgi:hypothetical protein